MRLTKRDERFLQSTAGQIVLLLRGQERTVDELAQELGVTGNAVRAHLVSLERDGVVQEVGSRAGVRKSHRTYSLTKEGDELFPKGFDTLFTQLLTVLKSQLGVAELKDVLKQTGRSLAPRVALDSFDARLNIALKVLSELGGCAALQKDGSGWTISSKACPLGPLVCKHPEVCELARALLEEILKTPVEGSCRVAEDPQCCFKISSGSPKAS